MTRKDVAKRVQAIAALDSDGEEPHSEEDRLYRDVLAAIAAGTCADPAGCAEEALKTQAIDFARWCA